MSDFMKELCKYYMRYLDTDFKEKGMPNRRFLKEDIKTGDKYTWDLDDYPGRKNLIASFKNNLENFPTEFGEEILPLNYTREASEEYEFYLNIGEVYYKEVRYPLFYLRLSVERTSVKEFLVEPNQQFYFHTKLIEALMRETGRSNFKIPNRMHHIGQFEKNGLQQFLEETMKSVCDFFELEPISLFDKELKVVKNEIVMLRNSLAIALFDKADESVINDYEHLISALSDEGRENFNIFESIAESFIYKNPSSFNSVIEKEYEERSMPERFSYKSPIPLNNEQQQILMAVKNEKGCDRIVIEGPPGTGKSHTIAAIIYDALLRGKTVLVTSDKEEALNVVVEKMNQVLEITTNKVEINNPILRLDGKNSNLTQILETTNFKKITEREKIYNNSSHIITQEEEDSHQSINNKLLKEKEIRKKLMLPPLSIVREFDTIFDEQFAEYIHIEEFLKNPEIIRDLYSLIHNQEKLKSYSQIRKEEVELLLAKAPHSLIIGKEVRKDNLSHLAYFLEKSTELGFMSWIFKRNQRKSLEKEFQEKFLFSRVENPLRLCEQLKIENDFYNILNRIEGVDLFQVTREQDIFDYLRKSKDYYELRDKYNNVTINIPKTRDKFNKDEINPLLSATEEDIDRLIIYLQNLEEYEKCLLEMANLDIKEDRKQLENRLVMQLVNTLDNRLVKFLESHRNDATELKKIVRKKKQLTRSHVELLLKAMPILVVGIRDLGNYLPLEKNLFDLLIIDEASQVSIAQAFPAIIRAKKTVILGDPKQFDNVKSQKANKVLNKQAFLPIKAAFEKELQHLAPHEKELRLSKVDDFNVSTNILRFMQGIANYHAILQKHFRSYIELISYSNEFFYGKSLQVMKIRGVSKEEIIKFYQVKAESSMKGKEKVNQEEALFIMEELSKLKEKGFKGTVGILSPTTDQVKYIQTMIDAANDATYFREVFKLKIFTFDSCQGEEMDIIYYSLVERNEQNILANIFMVDETRFGEGEDAPLDLKRLNVGLSRAKESVRFVHSKPIEEFKGNIRKALLHFKNQLNQPDSIELFDKTDKKSPMENVALNCILQTNLFRENQEEIEIIPQFPVGEYIKQLDPYAPDRKYVTDFLIMLGNKKVIVEYDGFREHFNPGANMENYEDFRLDQDIERQRTIESYGYNFIRLNKFNMRNDPVKYLNEAFAKHFRKSECV